LYNPNATQVNLNGWRIVGWNGATISLSGTIAPSQYLVITPNDNTDYFRNLGGEIALLDNNGNDSDIVRYGDKGGAPLAPAFPLSPSMCRAPDASTGPPFFDGANYSDAALWTMDLTSTFTEMNDAPNPALGTSVRINEVQTGQVKDVVELYYPEDAADVIDLSDWYIVDGLNVFVIPDSSIAQGDVVTIDLFGGEIEVTNLVYLFNNLDVRVDQMGVVVPPLAQETCFARCPDGAGPADGFDFPSSGGDESLLVTTCTLGELNTTNPTCQAVPVRRTHWGKLKSLYR
jgi:hypothetical protein